MALPGFTPQEELELYYLVRNIAWRLRVDEAEALLAEDIARIVAEARTEAGRKLLRIDPDKLTPEAVAKVLAETKVASGEDKQPTLLRDAVTAGLAAVAGVVFVESLREYSDILSVEGEASVIRTVTMDDILSALGVNVDSDDEREIFLQTMFRDTPLNGRTLQQWVDVAFDAGFGDVVRAMDEGIARGETHRQIVRRIMGAVTTATEREAVTLARTYVQSVAVAAQEAVYEANADVVGWLEWSAILEPGYKQTGHGTCIRCAALDGMRWRALDKYRPYMPLHWRCRCSWKPVVDWESIGIPEMALDEKTRPYTVRPGENIDTGGGRVILEAGQVKESWGEWAANQGDVFKVNAIGPERYRLWRESGLPFDEFMRGLVDPATGDLYTIPQLEGRLRRVFLPGGGGGNFNQGSMDFAEFGFEAHKAIRDVAERGLPTPGGIRFDIRDFDRNPDGVGAYMREDNVISFNPQYTFRDMAKMAEEYGVSLYGAPRSWSTTNPAHVIHHELGHAANYLSNPDRFDRLMLAGSLNSRMRNRVESEVSAQALKGPVELVAEVFAGLMDGKEYSEAVMKWFKAYGGVW